MSFLCQLVVVQCTEILRNEKEAVAQNTNNYEEKEPLEKIAQACCSKSEGCKGKKLYVHLAYLEKSLSCLHHGLCFTSDMYTCCQYLLNYTKRMNEGKALFSLTPSCPCFQCTQLEKQNFPLPPAVLKS